MAYISPSSKPASRKRRRRERREFAVTGNFRYALHRVEELIGLFPSQSGYEAGGRFRAPVLLPPTGSLPMEMRKIFNLELSALERIGRTTGQCHVSHLGPYGVFCLPYYYYDGFNALIYLEGEDGMCVAWKEQELHPAGSPAFLVTTGEIGEAEGMIRQILEWEG